MSEFENYSDVFKRVGELREDLSKARELSREYQKRINEDTRRLTSINRVIEQDVEELDGLLSVLHIMCQHPDEYLYTLPGQNLSIELIKPLG